MKTTVIKIRKLKITLKYLTVLAHMLAETAQQFHKKIIPLLTNQLDYGKSTMYLIKKSKKERNVVSILKNDRDLSNVFIIFYPI